MAKKASDPFTEGALIRVKDGVSLPEFPDLSITGWSGVISEKTGKKPNVQFVIEWDEATLGRMPPEYIKKCEETHLYFKMACLKPDDVELASG